MRLIHASKPAGALAVLAALALLAGPVADAQEQSDEARRLQQSTDVLRDMTRATDDAIPEHLLRRAEAIVVVPTLVKGGFIIGAKHGKGVITVRDREAERWSAPAFLNMTGGSIGWQIGAQAIDLVLLVMNEKGVTQLLEDRFTLGANASVAAGPMGRSADAATDAQLDAEILAYSRSKGLFAGATFEGAALHADRNANEAFYGDGVTLEDVLARRSGVVPAPARTFLALVRDVAGTDRPDAERR